MKFYEAYQAIADSAEYKTLEQAQQKTIENALRDFKLAGVALNAAAIGQVVDVLNVLCQRNRLKHDQCLPG